MLLMPPLVEQRSRPAQPRSPSPSSLKALPLALTVWSRFFTPSPHTHTGSHGFHSQEEIPEQPQGFLCQPLNSILPADRLPDLGKLPWSWQPSMGIAPFQRGFCPPGPQSSVRSSNVLQNIVFPRLAFAFVLPATLSRWFSVGTLCIICAQMWIRSAYNLCPQDAELLMPSDAGGLNSHPQKGRQRLCSGDRIMDF